jgi:tetratricopeptide (TPR) repeat protein
MKTKITLLLICTLLLLTSFSYAEISYEELTRVVSAAGNYVMQNKMRKVVLLLEGELPKSVNGGESKEYIATYGLGYNNLGYAYLRLGQYDKAIKALNKSKEVLGRWPANYFLLGQAYYRSMKFGKGIENFKIAMRMAPNEADLNDYICMTAGYIMIGKEEEAEKVLEIAREKYPQQKDQLTIAEFKKSLKRVVKNLR